MNDQSNPRLGPRTATAVFLGKSASKLSKALGRGSGAIIGGRVTMAVDSKALKRLTTGRQVILVTGTNGKTTTTKMITAAFRTLADVASNITGANMPDGHVAALTENRTAPFAVLEVDEMHLDIVAAQVNPAAIVLLNLTRDQLDRVGEVRKVERRLRACVEAYPHAYVVSNVDDPMTASAALGARTPVWVAAGAKWTEDATLCPRCGGRLETGAGSWHCVNCDLRRPTPQWTVQHGDLVGPGGVRLPLKLRLPGSFNQGNAAMALACGAQFSVPLEPAVYALREITEVAGRYGSSRINGRTVRLLLAKNPAGWREMLEMDALDRRPLMLAANGREADGFDLSWLWDVDFELLAGRRVVVTGERAADLAVRLTYAEVEHVTEPNLAAAVALLPADAESDVIANYTAFNQLTKLVGGAP